MGSLVPHSLPSGLVWITCKDTVLFRKELTLPTKGEMLQIEQACKQKIDARILQILAKANGLF
jgi:hypothetical protein